MNTLEHVTLAFTEGQLVRLFHGRPESVIFEVKAEAAKMIANLTPEHRAYITHPDRGQYRGFSAWHDLCDANMMLPGSDEESDDLTMGTPERMDVYTDFCNAVIAEFNRQLFPSQNK